MLILGLKGTNLDQKKSKMGGDRFFRKPKSQFSKGRPSDKFIYQNSAKFNEPFGRYKPKC